ncbi:MAG TPA: ABC transporter substrate-binding protein [Gaiellaceae bacterium]|jgi:osmoprotectant transport system substrate-binding protein|nr:ABC transporter substrate-binding protein [Gaiellaceae bacterium]
MVRKHTRRAAKAAYAVSLAVAIVIGLIAAGAGAAAPSAAKPTVTIGTKNFTEQYVLGELYKQALEAKGYKVVYKENIGSSELIDTAIKSGKINFYPEYDGVIVTDLAKKPFPKSAAATYAQAKTWEQGRGLTLLNATPFFDSDGFVMLKSTATKNGIKTIADMKKLKSFSYAGFPECKTRITCLLGIKNIYGLKQVKFVPLASISVYTLLDQGKVTAGDGFSTDPQLQTGKYVTLTDTKHIFGFQNVAPVVTKALAGDASLVKIVNAVSAKLTVAAIAAMNKAVGVDKKTPAAVASAFLTANKLK